MQRALLSRSGWEQTAARQTQQCSPPQRMQSRFSEFPYYFSSFPFWCCGPHRSHPPTAEPTAPPSDPQAGTPAGLWCQNHPPRWQEPSPPRPPSGPPHGASFFFGVPVSFCLIPLALPPSCILTRPLAAKSASNAIYTSIVYTQPQAPVNVLRCLVRGVSWKFSTMADTPCGKRTEPPYYCIQKKKSSVPNGIFAFSSCCLDTCMVS